jgi:hypothetical protein
MKYAVEILDATKIFVGDLKSPRPIGASPTKSANADEQNLQRASHSTNPFHSPPQQDYSNNEGTNACVSETVPAYADSNWHDLGNNKVEVPTSWFQDFNDLVDIGAYQIDAQSVQAYGGGLQDNTESRTYGDDYYLN